MVTTRKHQVSEITQLRDVSLDDMARRVTSTRTLLMRIFFSVIGCYLVWRENLISLILHPSGLYRIPFFCAVVSSATFVAGIVYIAGWKRRVKRDMDYRRWKMFAPRSTRIMSFSGLCSMLFWPLALWPILGSRVFWLCPLLTACALNLLSLF